MQWYIYVACYHSSFCVSSTALLSVLVAKLVSFVKTGVVSVCLVVSCKLALGQLNFLC